MKLVYDLTDNQLNIPVTDIGKYATIGEPESDTIVFLDKSFVQKMVDADENDMAFVGWNIAGSNYIFLRPVTKEILLLNAFGNNNHSWDEDITLHIQPVFENEMCKTTKFKIEPTDAQNENSYNVMLYHEGHIRANELQKVNVTTKIVPFRANDMPIPEIPEEVIDVDIFGGLDEYQDLNFDIRFPNVPEIIVDDLDKATILVIVKWVDKASKTHEDILHFTNDKPQVTITGEGHIKTDGWIYADDINVSSEFMERTTSSFDPSDDLGFLQQLFKNPFNHLLSNLISEIIRKLQNPTQKVLWSGSSYMSADQTRNFSDLVSNQRNGVVLIWSRYEGETKNWGWIYNFIPKWQVKNYDGTGIHCQLAGFKNGGGQLYKYIYLYDDKIKGYDYNKTNEYSKKFVLRAVLGV